MVYICRTICRHSHACTRTQELLAKRGDTAVLAAELEELRARCEAALAAQVALATQREAAQAAATVRL